MENRYFAIVKDGVIFCVGIGEQAEEITAERYADIIAAFSSKPAPTDKIDYRLKEDLSWEAYEIPEPQDEPHEATPEDYENALSELGVRV